MQIISKILSKEMFFLSSVVIYSLFSTTTPKTISLVEISLVFFFLLSLSINFFILKNIFNNEKFYILIILLFFLLIVSNLDLDNSFVDGKYNQAIRDFLAMLFLFIPYAMLTMQTQNKKNLFFVPISLCIGGLIIIYYRLFYSFFLMGGDVTFKFVNLDYIFNDALILFAVNFLFFYSIIKLKGFPKFVTIIFFFTTTYLLIIFSVGTGTKNFHIGFIYSVFIALVYVIYKKIYYYKKLKKKLYFFYKNYFKIFSASIFFILLGIIFVFDINLVEKLLNSRNKEIEYFLNFINNKNYIDIFFGKGIGSTFYIRYDEGTLLKMGFIHLFPLYLILKVGLLGFLILFIYFNRIFYLNKISFKSCVENLLLNEKNIVFHSCFITLIGSITFYTNFKHLSFWLIMGALALEIRNKFKKNENY